jgi:membrane protein DedA with SNARE-associated domain
MEEFVLNCIELYGPFAVFLLLMLSGIGIPLGEDFIVIPAGILVAGGHMNLELTALMAYLGVVCSDALWFTIISRYGSRLLEKRWLRRMVHPRRLLQAKHQLDKRGAWMIAFARFIPGSRSSAITVAAMLHMPFWKFAVASASCTLVTVPLQLGLGVFIAQGIGTKGTANLLLQIVGLIMLLIAFFVVGGLIRNHRKSKKGPPRAKAKWLRRFRLARRKPFKPVSTVGRSSPGATEQPR